MAIWIRSRALQAALIVLAFSAHAIEPGIYSDPEQEGYGIALAQGSSGFAALLFTYSPDGDQAWFLSDTGQLGDRLDLFAPSGLFPSRLFELGEPVGWVEMLDNRGRLSVRYWLELWPDNCAGRPLPGPLPPVCAGVMNLNRIAD